MMRTLRQRVWEAANVKLEVVTLDTDTTVHTLYGRQMGGRKSSQQPALGSTVRRRRRLGGLLSHYCCAA